jgi:hypothetical protein
VGEGLARARLAAAVGVTLPALACALAVRNRMWLGSALLITGTMVAALVPAFVYSLAGG